MKTRYDPILKTKGKDKSKKSNKSLYLITALVFLLSVFMLYVAVYLNSLMVLKTQEIYASIKIGDRGGFDVNKSALTFGMIRPGDGASRSLFVENNYSIPIKIDFDSEGNISRFLRFEKEVYLVSGENKTLSFSAVASVDEPYGFYGGMVKAVFKRAS
jgi:cytochrome c oxidase assembly protein Cox11